jgi:hypothetical protein
MAAVSVLRLVGSDTITINGMLLSNLPHGEVAKLTYNSDIAALKTGKNGNAIIAKNEVGNQATLELKVLRGSADDKMLNTQVTLYNTDPTTYVVMTGSVIKKIGNGAGAVTNDVYALTGGVITKRPEVVSNVEGDVEQAITVYTIQFAYADRSAI